MSKAAKGGAEHPAHECRDCHQPVHRDWHGRLVCRYCGHDQATPTERVGEAHAGADFRGYILKNLDRLRRIYGLDK